MDARFVFFGLVLCLVEGLLSPQCDTLRSERDLARGERDNAIHALEVALQEQSRATQEFDRAMKLPVEVSPDQIELPQQRKLSSSCYEWANFGSAGGGINSLTGLGTNGWATNCDIVNSPSFPTSSNYLQFYNSATTGYIQKTLPAGDFLTVRWGCGFQQSQLFIGGVLKATQASVNVDVTTTLPYATGNQIKISEINGVANIWSVDICSYDPSPIPTLTVPIPTNEPTLISPIPTNKPIVNPTPQPTPAPSLTLPPTLQPIPVPSPLPSPVPTMSPFPTPLPSLPPSPRPSPAPTITAQPTPLPTLIPTSSPTPVPSFSPTPLPTLVPTVFCISGTYYDGLECQKCDIGRYSDNNNNSAPWPTNCTLCPAGRYNTEIGSPFCLVCDTGKLSSPTRHSCKDCQAGEYNFNDEECRSCEFGKYAPQPQTGGCIECGAGSHTNNATGATTCSPCNAGTYSSGLTSQCAICSKGSFSASGQGGCTFCSKGSFSANAGSASCQACSAGTVSSGTGESSCEECSPGAHQPAQGQIECLPCSPGFYAKAAGALSCSACTAAYLSVRGAVECELANKGYYLDPFGLNANGNPESVACPKEATCGGSLRAPIPRKNFWVDRSKYDFVADLYRCPRHTCLGANTTTCWDRKEYRSEDDDNNDSERCNSDALQCGVGASGPLCGSCETGYIYRSETKECGPCEEAMTTTFAAGAVALAALMLSIAVTVVVIPNTPNVRTSIAFKFFSSFDSGSFKVIWVTYQIIMSTSLNLDISYPPPFSTLLGMLSVFSLDFLALECFQEDVENRYYTTVILWSTIPIMLGLAIFIVGGVRVHVLRRSLAAELTTSDNNHEQAHIINQHIWCALLLSYLVLPPVANKQLQSLDCIPFHHDESSYLRVDTAINCNSENYKSFQVGVSFFIALYQTVPFMWIVLLYRFRESLVPPTSSNDRKLALYIRDRDHSLDALRFLFNDYKCEKYWFEVAEMYRRILFVGILPLVSPVSATRASLGVVLSIASIAYFREEEPYRVKFTNFIAHIAQFVILITFYAALAIDTGVMIDFGLKDLGMGIFLVLVNVSIFLLSVYLGWIRFKRELRLRELMVAKANTIEQAGWFTDDKFKTTFEAISHNSVTASHVLMFHYTTLALAKMALDSGVPALNSFGGVPLTIRRPHQLTDSDRKAFQDVCDGGELASEGKPGGSEADKIPRLTKIPGCPFEAVLAISLPIRVLDPLPGYENDDGLCVVPLEVLQCMRPTSFVGVLKPKPWLEGYVLLPPPSIVRTYALTPDDIDRHDDSKGFRPNPSWVHESESISLVHDVTIEHITSAAEYLFQMRLIRNRAESLGVVPLYHFTSPVILPMIIEGGIRMSTQGQGDGGVYFSTLGPANYGMTNPLYEYCIIKECFGLHRLEEFTGKGKLDGIVVYALSPKMLQKAPGGRDMARMVPRSTFDNFSLPHHDGTYFLRPSLILGCFVVECANPPTGNVMVEQELEREKNRDKLSIAELESMDKQMDRNMERLTQVKIERDEVDNGRKSMSSNNPMLISSRSNAGTKALKSHDTSLSVDDGFPPARSQDSPRKPSDTLDEHTKEEVEADDDKDPWVKVDGEPGKKSYFWNKVSGETSWEKPALSKPASSTSSGRGTAGRLLKASSSSATWSAAKSTISSGFGCGGSGGGSLETPAGRGSVELQETSLGLPSSCSNND